jgi:trehalose 2-sulfotransferase
MKKTSIEAERGRLAAERHSQRVGSQRRSLESLNENKPHTSYLVCGTPRSGSSLLCEALISTGIAGKPEEYFQPQNEIIWGERWNTPTYAEYLASTIKQCTTTNSVFGVKMMWGYFDNFISKVRQLPNYHNSTLSNHALMQNIFPNLHYIWIKRGDKVKQAVSFVRAQQTNIWKVTSDPSSSSNTVPTFSYQKIDLIVHEFEVHELEWQKYFATHGIKPFIVIYEDFVANYEETAIEILKYLGLPEVENIQFAPRLLKKQADDESEQWVQRYYQLRTQRKHHRMISYANRQLQIFLQTTKLGRSIIRQLL